MRKIYANNYVYDNAKLKDTFDVVSLLFEKMSLDGDGLPINLNYAPFYVLNCCLFCELCFKSFILRNGNDVEYTHDLLELFKKLTDAEKKAIAENTVSYFGPSGNYIDDFKTLLDKEKNNFIQFRYLSFDNQEYYTCCSFLNRLSNVLLDMI